MSPRRLADMILGRPEPPYDERPAKAAQTEALRSELSAILDRVDKLVPPQHARLASYRRTRIGR